MKKKGRMLGCQRIKTYHVGIIAHPASPIYLFFLIFFSRGSNIIWAIPYITNTSRTETTTRLSQQPPPKLLWMSETPALRPALCPNPTAVLHKLGFVPSLLSLEKWCRPLWSSWHNKLKASLLAKCTLDQGRVAGDGVFLFNGEDGCPFPGVVSPGWRIVFP